MLPDMPLSLDIVTSLSAVATLLCLLVKLPQIALVLRTDSMAGISRSSLMLEFWR